MSTENDTPIEQALRRFLDGEPEPGDGAALAAAMEKDEQFASEVCRLLAVDDLLRQAVERDPVAFTESLKVRLAAEEDGARFTEAVRESLGAATTDAAGAYPTAAGTTDGRATPRRFRRSILRLILAGAACAAVVLLVFGVLGQHARGPTELRTGRGASRDLAWLNNAQNCRWAEGGGPLGDMGPGKVLNLEQGLAELCFRSGACVVLQGPATLELRSCYSIRLLRGRLAARVPEAARGFEVLSPEGKVVDLGTEFGLNVADDGSAQVYVFRGEVQAQPVGKAPVPTPVSVREQQSARIGGNGVSFEPGDQGGHDFVREIVSPPVVVPRTLALDFRRAVEGTLPDVAGLGTGLTHRLPGTGQGLPAHDPHLRLKREAGQLELTTTQNDLNEQFNLGQGEYPGVRLSDLGFTGTEDFSVAVGIPNTPILETVDQFGLYAGVKSDRNIRGGLLRPGKDQGEGHSSQFIVENNGGSDSHRYMVGLVSIGDNLRLTLQRVQGKCSLMVENRTTGQSSTLTIAHPEFLDGERDLYVGLFGATPWRDKPRTFLVKEFQVTVWTRSPDTSPHPPEKKKQG